MSQAKNVKTINYTFQTIRVTPLKASQGGAKQPPVQMTPPPRSINTDIIVKYTT